jgi:VanZ family protein
MPKLTRITVFGIRLATIVLVIYWIALFTGTHMPSPPRIGVRVSDKVHHFTAFFGLATLLYWVVPARRGPLRKVAFVMFVALTYAAVDESTQAFSPNRSVDLKDFFANSAGILAATLFYLVSRAIFVRFIRGRDNRAFIPPAEPVANQRTRQSSKSTPSPQPSSEQSDADLQTTEQPASR